MALLKSQQFLDKLTFLINNLQPNDRTFVALIQINIKQNDKVVKRLMIDLHELNVYEVNFGNDCNENIINDLLLTMQDDDLAKIGNREVTFGELHAVNKIIAVGNCEYIAKLDEKIQRK